MGMGTAMLGSGLGASMIAGAGSGVVSGQVARATDNALSGRPVTEGLGNPGDMLKDAAIGAAGGAIAYGVGRLLSGSAASAADVPCSFSADTVVATKEGKKAIASLKLGELVLAYNEKTNAIGYYPVVAVLVHEDKTLTKLIVDGEYIETTPEHPFYTEEEGWTPAGELRSGMHVRQADGSDGVVWFAWEVHEPETMYNLTVDTAHTFFVGEGQWLVHNTCKPVYRVWGNDSPSMGHYWSEIDPRTVPNYRSVASLPPGNSGEFLNIGTLIDDTGVTSSTVTRINPADIASLPQLIVPDPELQIILEETIPLIPPY
jgi:hypothetical protein